MSLALFVLACTHTPPVPAPEGSSPETAENAPDLAVLIVVDQLPVRLLEAAEPLYEHGLKRLLADDAARLTARYAHAITYTCPGHATISTGAAPSVSGIVSNDWYVPAHDGEPGKHVYCGDPAFLRVGTLADRVHESGGKVVSVALKDRAAMMLGGTQADVLSFYDKKAGAFTAPLQEVDTARWHQPWEALHPGGYERLVGPDDDPNEADPGIGTTFPHPAPDARSLLFTPFAGEALVDAVLAGVDAGGIGQDATPDLLTLSFSQTDYIGHAFTSESWEALDGMVRLDRSIGRLMEALDERFGAENITYLLTSDHGASVAEGAVRVPPDAVVEAADGALEAAGLASGVIVESPSLWLPPELTTDPEVRTRAAALVAEAVSAVPGIEGAYAWRVTPPSGPHADAVSLSLDDERSGDVYVLRGANALFDYSGRGQGTSHGTPFAHDTEVPFLAAGARVKPTRGTVDVRQVAPTVSALLGLDAPEAATLGPAPLVE